MDQKRILIVGDKTLSSEELNMVLSVKDNIIFDLADNFEDGLRIFKKESPDILISRVRLNGSKTGMDFVQKTWKIKKIPVIYVTDCANNQLINQAFKTFPDSFLIKPYAARRFTQGRWPL